MGLPDMPQVVDLVQKLSDWRSKVGGGLDQGITIPKAQAGLWVPQVTLPAVSLPRLAPELSLLQMTRMQCCLSGSPFAKMERRTVRQHGDGRRCMNCSELQWRR